MITKLSIETKEVLDTSSVQGLKLISKNEYRSVLRKYLPDECFEPDVKHVLHYLTCMAVYLSGMYGIVHLQIIPLKILLAIVMGISLGALTFFLHDLFHGSIFKSKPITYLFGMSVGMFNLFAPLFWQRVHNLHHARTGNVDDPDRSYILAELPKDPISKIAYRTRISEEAYHPLLSLVLISTGFFWYFFATMFYGLIGKKSSIKEDMKYQKIQELFKSKKEALFVLGELIFIFAFQCFLFTFVAKSNFSAYFLISLFPVAIAHFIAMSYIHTNHFLSPLTGDIDDPLINSLSLKNSWIVDKIFSNFSHHVEHHLFPAMGSSHYPKIRKLLLELYPSRFQLIPMVDAIKLLCKTPRIYGDYTHLITSDGKKRVKCLMPTL
ncbi:MAG: fatty acid desaturase [Candidatus Melainabacteria bacterium]|nr:fatty acid desaturase [Candidatus Melainabacteria bacterium]